MTDSNTQSNKQNKIDAVKDVAGHFRFGGAVREARPFGSGHINDTFLVTMDTGETYIIQRINHSIFPEPGQVMENITRATEHIHAKLEKMGTPDINRRVLTCIETVEGGNMYRDDSGNYWRAFLRIDNTVSFDRLDSPRQAYEAAFAFGTFMSMLDDFPARSLHEVIPHFHDGPRRFQAFKDAVAADVCDRVKEAKEEIDFLLEQGSLFDVVPEKLAKGELPIRVTHNDTKLNNVLMDAETNQGLCVIDLDTVMPGVSLYDFGDLGRTTLCDAMEDDLDLSKVVVLIPRFEAILKGFFNAAGDILTDVEKQLLVFSCKLMPLIIGCRFLTDFLAGDVYFKTRRRCHNLDRSRVQFKMMESVMENEEKMEAMVAGLV